MAELKFLVRVPMDCWRQWIRHRTANVNEYSTRYSVAIDSAQATPPDQWRTQASTNRQGSEGFLSREIGAELSQAEMQLQRKIREEYQRRIEIGVAREQARKDLPLSTYTEAYWKIDLHNLLHFLALRMDSHAQTEIRQYATVIGTELVKPLFPDVWAAFVDYRLQGMILSRQEVEVIRRLILRLGHERRDAGGWVITEQEFLEAQHRGGVMPKKCRERDECWQKMALLFREHEERC